MDRNLARKIVCAEIIGDVREMRADGESTLVAVLEALEMILLLSGETSLPRELRGMLHALERGDPNDADECPPGDPYEEGFSYMARLHHG